MTSSTDFDGVSSRITFGPGSPIDDLPNGDYSAMAWIYLDGYGEGSFGRIMQKAGTNNWVWFVDNNNSSSPWDTRTACLSFQISQGGGHEQRHQTDTNSILTSTWYHVAFTWDNTAVSFQYYINGTAANTNTVTNTGGAFSTFSDSSGALVVGNDSGSTRTFDGQICNVKLYDKKLSADEINEIYRNTDSVPANNIGYYPLRYMGSAEPDYTNNYTGTRLSTASSTNAPPI